MPDLAQLQTWLSEALAARHALMSTGGVTEIWRDGRRITYSRAKPGELDSYIAWLNAEIAKLADPCRGRRSSMGVVWGG